MATADLKDELNCSICLNIYTEPATLRCGHSFCQGCIRSVLDRQDGVGIYTCPECRAEYQKRPPLRRNLKLCNIVEHFLSKQPDVKPPGIFCTYCVHASVPAVKTCLMCEASLCSVHLSVHSKSTDHVLTEPTSSMDNRKCATHREMLKYYCCKDAACICVSCCVFGEHRGHQVELLKEASEKKKEKLRKVLEKLSSKREETEKSVQSLQDHKRGVQEKAANVTSRVTALFKDIRAQLQALEERVLSDISRQRDKVSLSVTDLIQQLEINREELSRKMTCIEELCQVPDPLVVLQGRDVSRAEPDEELGKRLQAVGNMDEVLISLTLQSSLSSIVTDLKQNVNVQNLLLDIKTAAVDVAVSGDLKSATWSKTPIWSKAPQRFKNYCQVLSFQSFSSGQIFWEVETSELGNWRVGVAYPSMERKGDLSGIGQNNKSWCLRLCQKDYLAAHAAKEIPLQMETSLQRLGVFLDYEAGRLSFYQLCEPIQHLHTFTATFREPLHAVFLAGMMDAFSVMYFVAVVLPIVLITGLCISCRRKIPAHLRSVSSQGTMCHQDILLTIPKSPTSESRRSSVGREFQGYPDGCDSIPPAACVALLKSKSIEVDDYDDEGEDPNYSNDNPANGYIEVLPDEGAAKVGPVLVVTCDVDNRASLSSVGTDENYVNVGNSDDAKAPSIDGNYVNVGDASDIKGESLEYVNLEDAETHSASINQESEDDDIPEYENIEKAQ
ncbi:E3 ubiquitin-protein ligase TRIM39-like isoform X2 [Phyllobates terribilis]|uniref:E3 ubiquitin-protein ligase TRIM39-like isoform X2 n=1 Tax=Phyllobates terribilis TaxID=111132 RepID=UPI003CCA84C3